MLSNPIHAQSEPKQRSEEFEAGDPWPARHAIMQALFHHCPNAFDELRLQARTIARATEEGNAELDEWIDCWHLATYWRRPAADYRSNIWLLSWTRRAAQLLADKPTLSAEDVVTAMYRSTGHASIRGRNAQHPLHARDAQMLAQYLAGASHASIAQENDLSVESVKLRLRTLTRLVGLPLPERRGRPRKNR